MSVSTTAKASGKGLESGTRFARIDPWALLLLPATLALAVSFALPIGGLLLTSLHRSAGLAQIDPDYSLSNYSTFLTDRYLLHVLADTVTLGAAVVLLTVLIAFPLAYVLARTRSKARGTGLFLVIAPLLVSAVIRNAGWFPILSGSGLVNRTLMAAHVIHAPLALASNVVGVVIGLVHALLPFMVLTLLTSLQRIDRELEEAAKNLGAHPVQVFWHLILPLSLPGLLAGSLIVFTLAISAYTTPAILGGGRVGVMSIYIAQQFQTVLDYPSGATAAAILMALCAAITALATRLQNRAAARFP